MIYGMLFGLTIIITAFTRELIPFYFVLLGGIACIVIVAFVKMQGAKKISSPPAPVSITATAGTPTSPPPAPTPAPVAASKSSNWAWLMVLILAIVVVIWVIAPMITKTTTQPPQATALKKILKEHTVRRPLEFLGAEHIVDRGPGWVKIQKERGRANFHVRNIPIIPGAKYKVYLYSKRDTTGLDWLEINAGKGNGAPFCYKTHPASDYPIETIFFEEGMGGEAKYFYSRDNFLKLWADDDLLVQLDKQPYVEIIYWE